MEYADEQFREGIHCFEMGRFWDAHEIWEEIWQNESGQKKLFVQACIQIAAALVHADRREWSGALQLIRKARKLLTSCRQPIFGMDPQEIIDQLERFEDHLKRFIQGRIRRFRWKMRPTFQKVNNQLHHRSSTDNGPPGIFQRGLQVYGVLLAGGASRRFGGDKRFYYLEGRPLLDIQLEKLRTVVDNVVILADPFFPFVTYRNVQVIRDPRPYEGPLVALTHLDPGFFREGLFLLAIDLIGISSRLIQRLMMEPPVDVRILRQNERIQPLCGYYSSRALRALRRIRETGEQSIVRAIFRLAEMKNLKVEILDRTWWRRFGREEDIFMNLNRPPTERF